VVKNITRKTSNCGESGEKVSCCKVESLINVDERGQMVLPKEIRDKANIHPGDKLALVSWEKGGKVCCFTLIKVEEFTDMVRGLLGPMMEEMIPKSTAH
jgi:AbrB family looped-hinge helix DNA binding protein